MPLDYDPMLAKLAVWAPTREAAADRMRRALSEYVVEGIRTNIAFFDEILADPAFRKGELSTAFLDEFFKRRAERKEADMEQEAVAALIAALQVPKVGAGEEWEAERVGDGGPSGDDAMKMEIAIDGRAAKLDVEGATFRYRTRRREAIERAYSVVPLSAGNVFRFDRRAELRGRRRRRRWCASTDGRSRWRFSIRAKLRSRKSKGVGEGRMEIAAMMPGKVVRVLVRRATRSRPAQGLVVVEAMKMQNEMKSPKAGRVVGSEDQGERDRRGGRGAAGDRIIYGRPELPALPTEPDIKSSSGTAWRAREKCVCAFASRRRGAAGEREHPARITKTRRSIIFAFPQDNPIARTGLGMALRQVKGFAREFPAVDSAGICC